MSLIENFRNIFKIEDLRNRIFYTIGILMVYRMGSYITLPGVDASALLASTAGANNSLLGLFDMFVGGAFLVLVFLLLELTPLQHQLLSS